MGTGKPWAGVRTLVREPLLHFLLLGALIFAADAIANPPSKRERVVSVTPELSRDLAGQFQEARGRQPTKVELESLIDAWITSEILYREAQSLGLDKGDEMIRERITHKMRLLIFNNIPPPEPTEADLRAWFEAHRDRFDQPEKLEFFEVSVGADDRAGEQAAQEDLAAIRAETEGGELRSRVRIYRSRSAASVDQAFGEGFADTLRALPLGTWSAIRSRAGWHIVRVDKLTPAVPADFDAVGGEVADQWRQEKQRLLAREAVKLLGARYEIRRDDRVQGQG